MTLKNRGRLWIKARYVPSFLFAIIAVLLVSALSHDDTTLGVDWITRNTITHITRALTLFLIVSLLPLLKFKKARLSSVLAAFSVLIMYALDFISKYNYASISPLVVILCVVFAFSPRDVQRRSFEIFGKIWLIVCTVGIICLISYALNSPIPYREVPYYGAGVNRIYVDYGVSILYKSGFSLRLCGICNEPGYFGTFCALLLCIDCMRLKKKSNIIIFIAGLLSFSLGFIMLVVIYWSVRVLISAYKEKNLRKKVWKYISLVAVLVCYLTVIPNIKTGNLAIDNTIERMTITANGLSGDNRTTAEFDKIYDSTPFADLLVGKGRGFIRDNNITSVSSYKVYILEYGLLGSFAIWGLLLIAVLYRNIKNVDILIFVIVFFASIYQRPNVMSLPYFVLLFGGIEYIKYTQHCLKKEKVMTLVDKNNDAVFKLNAGQSRIKDSK